MAKTTVFQSSSGAVAVHQSEGAGSPIVLIHGNSSSARAFSRQLDGALGQRRRVVAIDLLGHGQSANAGDPAAYLLPGHAHTLAEVAKGLALEDAVFVGWSLGGHILLEASPALAAARGFAIFGAPPLAFPPAMDRAFLPNPAMGVGFAEEIAKEQAEAYVASFFAPGFADIPPFFVEDALRTDGRARAQLVASIAPGGYLDEAQVVAGLKRPLAVLHGAEEQLVNGAYFAELAMPTLWRGSVQLIAGAGHAPQWEQAPAFDALLEAFAKDCG
ncbi:MAG: alpha/beta fold hydrolase [Roseiarcus sp.]|jgi:pimeloyl-ACP methyl ester carboxylesterase